MRDWRLHDGHMLNVTEYWDKYNRFTSDCLKWCECHIEHNWNIVSGTCAPHAPSQMHLIFEDPGDLLFFTWSFLSQFDIAGCACS
jgi:hypothetical protein